jgi:hypothetical protein
MYESIDTVQLDLFSHAILYFPSLAIKTPCRIRIRSGDDRRRFFTLLLVTQSTCTCTAKETSITHQLI